MKREFLLNKVLVNQIGETNTWKVAMSKTIVKMWQLIPIYSMRSKHIHVIWSSLQFTFCRPNQPCSNSAHRNSFATRDVISQYYSDYNLSWILFGTVAEHAIHKGNQRWKRIAPSLSWDKNNNNVHSNTYMQFYFFSSPFYSIRLSLHSNEYRIVKIHLRAFLHTMQMNA